MFDNLLKNNPNLNKFENFQVQPIIFKEKFIEDFLVVHENDSLEKSIDFLNPNLDEFKNHLEQSFLPFKHVYNMLIILESTAK